MGQILQRIKGQGTRDGRVFLGRIWGETILRSFRCNFLLKLDEKICAASRTRTNFAMASPAIPSHRRGRNTSERHIAPSLSQSYSECIFGDWRSIAQTQNTKDYGKFDPHPLTNSKPLGIPHTISMTFVVLS